MNLWHTTYKVQTHEKVSSSYVSYVIADNEDIARALLKLRGRGEVIESVPCKIVNRITLGSLAAMYKKRDLPKLLHTLCFVSEPVVNAGLRDFKFFLSDTGLVHEIVHELQFGKDDPDLRFRVHVHEPLVDLDVLLKFLGY